MKLTKEQRKQESIRGKALAAERKAHPMAAFLKVVASILA